MKRSIAQSLRSLMHRRFKRLPSGIGASRARGPVQVEQATVLLTVRLGRSRVGRAEHGAEKFAVDSIGRRTASSKSQRRNFQG